MQSRFPNENWENGRTAAPYSVFQGFADLFEDFEAWLGRSPEPACMAIFLRRTGCISPAVRPFSTAALSDSAAVRDYNPRSFLTNLIWNTRGERQCFQFGPGDGQDITWFMAGDPNAQISVISGAWAVPLFRSNREFCRHPAEAARLQKIEAEHLTILRSPWTKARVRIWTLAEFVENPMEPLQTIVDEISPRGLRRLTEAPRLADLTGLASSCRTCAIRACSPS